MAWWNKKAKADEYHKLSLLWSVKNEDFLADDLEGYPDFHTETILMDIKHLIPSKYHQRVYIAGGCSICSWYY